MKHDLADKVMVAVMVVLGIALAAVVTWGIVLLVQGPWYGSGLVTEKDHRNAYLSYCGKGCLTTIPECYSLKVLEDNGKEHEGCVSYGLWEEAKLGHHISITPTHR